MQTEFHKYHSKISKITNLSIKEIITIQNKVTKPIFSMSGFHIPESNWILAEDMVMDIDNKDTPYLLSHCFISVRFGLEIRHLE